MRVFCVRNTNSLYALDSCQALVLFKYFEPSKLPKSHCKILRQNQCFAVNNHKAAVCDAKTSGRFVRICCFWNSPLPMTMLRYLVEERFERDQFHDGSLECPPPPGDGSLPESSPTEYQMLVAVLVKWWLSCWQVEIIYRFLNEFYNDGK